MKGNPLTSPMDPVASARVEQSRKVFTSNLSISEFNLLTALDFEAVELVMGTSVYHLGWQSQNIRQSVELEVLTAAMYEARHNAMTRMEAEAKALDADGVVGMCLEYRPHGLSPEHMEFVATGTAIRSRKTAGEMQRSGGRPFTSHLSVQDFYTLLATGYAPVAFVLGTCVWHVASQGVMQTFKQMGRNCEMPQWTQGYYEARETAMSRMEAEAERDGARGVVGVHTTTAEWVWGAHTLEFYAAGTAVREFGEHKGIVPTLTLPLR